MNKKRDAAIVRLVTEEGWTQARVARVYGLTRERVRQICVAAGLGREERTHFKYLQFDVAQLYERHKAGESLVAIAADTGIDDSVLSAWFKEAGYKVIRHPFKWTFERVKPLHDDYIAGMTQTEIAKREGIQQEQVSYMFLYHGLYTRGRGR